MFSCSYQGVSGIRGQKTNPKNIPPLNQFSCPVVVLFSFCVKMLSIMDNQPKNNLLKTYNKLSVNRYPFNTHLIMLIIKFVGKASLKVFVY